MDIKYVVIENKGIVKAFPVVESEYAEGIDAAVAETLIKSESKINCITRFTICGVFFLASKPFIL